MKSVFTLCVQLTVFKHVEEKLLFGLTVTAARTGHRRIDPTVTSSLLIL